MKLKNIFIAIVIVAEFSAMFLLSGCDNESQLPLRVELAGAEKLSITSTGGSPITITRIVFNNRVDVAGCDITMKPIGDSTGLTLNTGDNDIVSHSVCGAVIVQVKIYTDHGNEIFAFGK